MKPTELQRNVKNEAGISHFIASLARGIGMQEWVIQRVNTPVLAVFTVLLAALELAVACAIFWFAVVLCRGIEHAIKFSNGR